MRAQARLIVALVLVLTAMAGVVVVVVARALGEVERFADVEAPYELHTGPQSTVIFDRRGRPAFSFHTEDRTDVALNQIAPAMVDAALAAEDKRFYVHRGLDPFRIVAAARANARAGRVVQGGSTITQQLSRALALSSKRTLRRKLQEVFLAARIEQRYSKQQILEAYLNKVYFGSGYYGVQAAASGYFGKTAAALMPDEAALLAGMIRAPITYSPRRSPERARLRRDLVLRAMWEQGRLNEAAYRSALVRPVTVRERREDDVHDEDGEPCGLYFKDEIRRQLIERFGVEKVYHGGLRVFATLDLDLQCEAERAVLRRLTELEKMSRAVRDAAFPLQGSLVSIDAASGEVLAIVGGRDFHTHRYNRATQAKRQPGSAFKPIIFAAALEQGYMPGSRLDDLASPIPAAEGAWLPDGEHEASSYTLRHALKVSSNRAAARLLQLVGASQAVSYAHRLGIESRLPAVPSLALGTGEVTLLELTAAYSAFANEGLLATPTFIQRVEDRGGATLWMAPAGPRRAVSPATAFLVTSMLSDAINAGTGYQARALGFRLPAAGKTGTTDNVADVWFIGYTRRLVTGVWFGFDQPAQIMRRGFAATMAVPAWAAFMKVATKSHPPEPFRQPPEIERAAICRVSGYRASEACRQAALWEAQTLAYPAITDVEGAEIGPAPMPVSGVDEDYFLVGSIPEEPCPVHSGSLGTADTAGGADSVEGTTGRMRLIVEQEKDPNGVIRTIIRQVPPNR